VAQRLQEQLETARVLSSTAAQEEAAAAGIAAHLSSSSDVAAAAMACSSSDLSGWIEGMIEELTASNGQHSSRSSLVTTDSPHCTHNTMDSLLDTTGFPSQQAAAPSSLQHYQETLVDRFTGQQLPCMTSLPESSNSWMLHHVPSTTSYSSKTMLPPPPSAPMERINGRVQQKVVNSNAALKEQEDSGVQLVHSLLACAEAVQHGDLVRAEETVCHIQLLASPPGPMGKVAAHFIEALTLRIYSGTSLVRNVTNYESDNSLTELLHFHYYETCPYLKFAHLTANQAILEAFEGEKQVHVIDFNLMHGLQWPALIQALALRPGGPPALLRLTGIGPPHASGNEIGMKLAQLAESVNIEFEFRGVVALKLDEVKPWMLQVLPGEAVAVNSVLQLHRLLYSDGPHVPAAIDDVLQSVLGLKPKIVTIVEHEANHNAPGFLSRFTEALHYYSTMFDSLEACNLPPQSSQQLLVEMYLGREICNIVACEGVARVERHENLEQWRRRMVKAGFQPLQLGLNALKQAKSLLTLFSGDGYRVEENNGCLTLGWHTRPLIASSAWQYA
jgi:DELLA protein